KAIAMTATTKDATTISSANVSLGAPSASEGEVHLGFVRWAQPRKRYESRGLHQEELRDWRLPRFLRVLRACCWPVPPSARGSTAMCLWPSARPAGPCTRGA